MLENRKHYGKRRFQRLYKLDLLLATDDDSDTSGLPTKVVMVGGSGQTNTPLPETPSLGQRVPLGVVPVNRNSSGSVLATASKHASTGSSKRDSSGSRVGVPETPRVLANQFSDVLLLRLPALSLFTAVTADPHTDTPSIAESSKRAKILSRLSKPFRAERVRPATEPQPVKRTASILELTRRLSSSSSLSSLKLFTKRSSTKPRLDALMISAPVLHMLLQEKIRHKFPDSTLMMLLRGGTAVHTAEFEATQLRTLVLHTTHQAVLPFDAYVELILPRFTLRKLAELLFLEVFVESSHAGERVNVLKVMALDGEMSRDDMVRELVITRAMSGTAGYVDYVGAAVVQGGFPEPLLAAWDRFASEFPAEALNTRPDHYDSQQLFLVIEMAYAGEDLEHFQVSNWQQAHAIFWAIVRALAVGEQQCRFEHRDLHWGNITIREQADYSRLASATEDWDMDLDDMPADRTTQVHIIDYTLLKMQSAGSLWSAALNDPQLFSGKGDYQFEVYKMMREWCNGDWEQDSPSNAFWAHYLADKLVHAKGLVAVDARTSEVVNVERETWCWQAMRECVRVLNPRGKRFGRGGLAHRFGSAGDVLAWGEAKGYV